MPSTYTSIPTDENATSDSNNPPPSSKRRWPPSVFYPIIAIALALLVAVLALQWITNQDSSNIWRLKMFSSFLNDPPQPPRYTNCGDTPAEARKRNCSFDLLSFSWQTQECHDKDLLDHFLSYHQNTTWKYYRGRSANASEAHDEVPMELAVLGEDRLFVSWEYHIVHCTYMYMAMHRAYTVRGYIDSHLDDWNHTRHCQKILLERNMDDVDISTVGFLRFPECRAVWDVGFAGSPQNEGMPWTRYD